MSTFPNTANAFIPWWRIEMGKAEAQAAYDTVMARGMTMGPAVKEFERQLALLLDVPYVVSTGSGTAALTLALLAMNIGPGDEVIVPNRTWIATAHAPYLLGARVVLVDVHATEPTMDVTKFQGALTPRTRAVIPVHLNGRPADMRAITALAAQHNIAVIEDACQALCAPSPDGGYLGTHGHCGCFSLSIGKLITTGQGGFVVTRDKEIAARLVKARTHGTSDITMAKWEMPGGNFRLWDVPASIGLAQLQKIESNAQKIRSVFNFYKEKLEKCSVVRLMDCDKKLSVPLYADAVSKYRDELVRFLAERNIQARPYYANISNAPHFKDGALGQYKNSDYFQNSSFILPGGPDRTESELQTVVNAIFEFENGVSHV